jgi:murein DD-endopeptidase MepM/ murein hydrolase activator NlpD
MARRLSPLGKPSNDTEANRPFGRQPDGTFHNGTDWGWGQGDGICAMADGIVSDISWSDGYGVTITVDHGRLIDGKVTQTRYRHIDRGGALVAVGDEVHRGAENIAVMGSSGSYAKGAKHLHSELLLDGKLADEQIYQKEANVAANTRTIGSGGAKRREEPTVAKAADGGENFDPAENYAPGTKVEWDGFIRSAMKGGSDDGDNIWLVKDGLYTKWTTTVPVPGDGALAGIKDMGTYRSTSAPDAQPPATASASLTRSELEELLAASELRIIGAVKGLKGSVEFK